MHEWQGEIVGGLDNPPGSAGPDDEHPPTPKQTREDMGNIRSDAESDAWEQRDQLTSPPAPQLASHVHDRKCVTHRRGMDASEGGRLKLLGEKVTTMGVIAYKTSACRNGTNNLFLPG